MRGGEGKEEDHNLKLGGVAAKEEGQNLIWKFKSLVNSVKKLNPFLYIISPKFVHLGEN